MIATSVAGAVPRPLAIDEELLDQEHSAQQHPQGRGPSIIEFFLQTICLYDILYDVLVGFYSSSGGEPLSIDELWAKYLGRSGINNGDSALDIERRLVQWERKLPAHLRVNESNEHGETSHYYTRQAVILKQR